MSKVVILDMGIYIHRNIFANWNNPKTTPVHTCLASIIGALRKVGVTKEDLIIMACDGRKNWRKLYEPCLIDDTEVLTDKGFLLLKDIVDNKLKVKIATLNPNTNKVEYHYPNEYYKVYYKGKMYCFGGERCRTDIVMTPGHKHYVKKQRDKEFSLKKVADIGSKIEYEHNRKFNYSISGLSYFKIPKLRTKSINWRKGVKYTYIVDHPAKKVPIKDWLKLLGWYLTEGSCGGRRYCGLVKPYTVLIPQSPTHNPIYCKEIEQILGKFGKVVKVKRTNITTFGISNTQIARHLKETFGNSFSKFIPRKLLNSLSKKQCQLLLHTLIKGDGSIYTKSTNKTYSYTTVSKQLADDVQELSYKSGYTCTISKATVFRKWYGLTITKNFTPRNKKHEFRASKWKGEGYTYDLEVPNHIFFVRRNGKCCWTGNCYKGDRAKKRRKSPIDWKTEYSKMNWLVQVLDQNTTWHSIRLPMIEADDIMAVASRFYKNNEIVLCTYDEDLTQMWDYPNVKIFSPMTKRYKIRPENFNVYKLISKKTQKETSDNLVSPILNVEHYDNRMKIVNLLELPEWVEQSVLAELSCLEPKEENLEGIPFKGLAERMKTIYNQDKIVTYESSVKYYQRKEDKKRKDLLIKRAKAKLDRANKRTIKGAPKEGTVSRVVAKKAVKKVLIENKKYDFNELVEEVIK